MFSVNIVNKANDGNFRHKTDKSAIDYSLIVWRLLVTVVLLVLINFKLSLLLIFLSFKFYSEAIKKLHLNNMSSIVPLHLRIYGVI